MKVFISFSHKNKEFVDRLIAALQEKKVEVWIDTETLSGGDDITKTIKKALVEIDYFIIVLSKDSVRSDWVNFELSATLVSEASSGKKMIVPILLEECELPNSINTRYYIDFRYSFEKGTQQLLKTINKKPQKGKLVKREDTSIGNYSKHIHSLQKAYQNGSLTLFCGAGISYEPGIPTWNELLKSLIQEVYSYDSPISIHNIDTKLAHVFQEQINLSPLIIAKYLKNLLGNNFLETTRSVLYRNCSNEGKIIKAIAELSRPKRGKKPLNAIVTFNFDDLIEGQLQQEKIAFKTICREGERVNENQIPIYHPHGFLPRIGPIPEDTHIVFSEDAYHEHFTDSFNWSNLIQLNQLNNNTCLFIGISLTDPNMRRIIDVVARKTGYTDKNHFIIKKRYTHQTLFPNPENTQEEVAIIQIVENIEEVDANKLGFHVIWIDDFEDIPDILLQIGK